MLLAFARPAQCAQVTALSAVHHDGQTFLTWTAPPGTGWKYKVYRSTSAIVDAASLNSAEALGEPADSSWCDRRLYSLCGWPYGFAVDSSAAPLDSTRGLFVWTAEISRVSWYAVTCRPAGGTEDRTVTPGGNSLVNAVSETPALPRPVYQRTMIGPWGAPADVYTTWTGPRETPFFPAMCDRPSEPYDCSIHHGATGGGLMFHAHVRGGSFYLADAGSGKPGEWQLTMDDFVRTSDANTFWFGYHQAYEIERFLIQPNPTSGIVVDYTARRVIHTLEWARRNFPVDTSRVYVMGASMGGIAGVFLAMWRPDLIAATMVNVPLFDFSFESDPNPDCAFNVGGSQRWTTDHLWGEVPTDLRMPDGTRVYDRLNCGVLAAGLESRFVSPIIAFSGRNDMTIGWAEKIPFYHAMNDHRAGGTFFWDTRTHTNTATGAAWGPLMDYSYVYRFRTNLSFPALSNCSANGNPGDGHGADGDSIGTINGFVEWDAPLADSLQRWKDRLTLRNLPTKWGPIVMAPDSVTVDVTPRRLQRFRVTAGAHYHWFVQRYSDGAQVQSGIRSADGMAVLTIPGVKVYRTGSVLTVEPAQNVGVGDAVAATGPRIQPLPCPLRGACLMGIEWPRAGEADVTLVDLAGRRVRALFRGRVEPGLQALPFDPGGLASGIYFVRARVSSAAAQVRVALIR